MVFTPSPDTEAHPTETDELSHLAALTGYSDETVTATTLTPSPLLDPEDFETEPDPTTQPQLWSNPWAKAVFVGSGLAIAIGLVAIFLHSVHAPTKTSATAADTAPAVATTASPATQPETDPNEIGRLKTVEALGTQTQALKEDKAQPTPPSPTVTTTPIPATAVSTPPVSHPAPVTYAPPPSYSAPMRSAPVASVAPAVQADPVKQWQTAVALGSYGQISYSTEKPSTAPPVASAAPSPDVEAAPKANDPDQTRYAADAAAILSGVPSHVVSILAGAKAAATLSTPVVWAQDLDSTQQPQRFGLQLTEPMLAADGTVALPAGTQMVTQVDTISESGLVELSVIAVVIPTASGNQVVPVPPGAVLTQGEQGNPLMASEYNHDAGHIQSLDAGVALMGALGKVGEILNRPNSQTSTGSVFYSSSTTTNPAPNILGAVLEGGFDALHDQVSDRQQQEIKDILSRPNVWYIPAGQPVQVFTGTSFEVAL
ncbi:TrbI/VirB10 family protein [Nodosilinea nodulosa]|uniref:TrbI/VirB10 family protein n=1 Tax=Nodosilinea nodulosa TaxID=416001 RepID=UPI0003139F76|nr:TrbI/VirB10 family protein [Nodosilinea nodulosa]